ncbi:hypothetical protein [Tepidimonas sp.]|uniref:hypothetical protein n=1 Tax=Tepidimonas sp. TaxID=2002775 RepID=UPI002FE06389
MLEPIRDQAAGLLAWQLCAPLRVLAVVAGGRTNAALELLWRLHQGYRDWGLDCRVLEGTPQSWGDDVDAAEVWLWHAPVESLVRWWPGGGNHPLVALRAEPAALVDGYRSLKRLHAAGLQPIVVALAGGEGAYPEGAVQATCTALQRTCRVHLNWVPTVWTLGYHEAVAGQPGTDDVLARLLDAAWMMDVAGEAGSAGPTC